MSVGAFSSDSQTDKRSSDQSQTASDQAVNIQTRKSNNQKNKTTYKNSTITIQQGSDTSSIANALSAGLAGLTGLGTATGAIATGDPDLDNVIGQRLEDNETAADAEIAAKSSNRNLWLIGVAVLLIALFAGFKIWRKH